MALAVLVATLDQTLGTMLRFFLIALAIVGPLAWWRLRDHRRRPPSTTPGPDAERASASADHDLAWLIAEIDRIARDPSSEPTALAVPAVLAAAVWGTDGDPSDRLGAALVGDALRRGGATARVRPAAGDGATVAVEIRHRRDNPLPRRPGPTTIGDVRPGGGAP